MDAMESLKKVKQETDAELARFFADLRHEVENIDPVALQMVDILKDYTLRGGKRIRPAILYHGYLLFSRENLKEIIKAGAALELVQSYLLIHDDVIDKDSIRRRGPTVHKAYEEIYKDAAADPEHVGQSLAIITGDLAVSLAHLILSQLDINASRRLSAVQVLNRMIHRVTYGEAMDTVAPCIEVDEEMLMKTYKLKTASYTVECPLHLAATLANAPRSAYPWLSAYAAPLGQAFQIQDDILGIFSLPDKTGKALGADIREGKKTLLVLKALESATPVQRVMISQALGSQELTEKQFRAVQKIMIETGALQYCKERVRELTSEAKCAIDMIEGDRFAKQFLREIADILKNRIS